MSTPMVREYREHERAPGAVAVRRRKPLRSHWLTGALVCTLVGLTIVAARQYYRVEQQFREVRLRRAALQAELQEAKRRNQDLRALLMQVTSDAYMELKARDLGFIYPNERVYQKGISQP